MGLLKNWLSGTEVQPSGLNILSNQVSIEQEKGTESVSIQHAFTKTAFMVRTVT